MKKINFILIFCLSNLLIQAQSQLSTGLNFNADQAPQFEKAEIGVKLPVEIKKQVNLFLQNELEGLNPYDPEQVDLTSVWTSPSGATQKVNGFFYQEYRKKDDKNWSAKPSKYNWLLRWSPDELGLWNVQISLASNGKKWSSENITFTCVESDSKGYLRANPEAFDGNNYLTYAKDNSPFYGIGHSIAHGGFGKLTPKKAQNQKEMLRALIENKCNFTRLELGMVKFLPGGFDCTNYTGQLEGMYEFDQILDLLERNDMYAITFRHHTEMSESGSWDKTQWIYNGFKSKLNLPNRLSYYTDKEAIRWQKNEHRYLFARWGYSKSFSFYGYSEIEGWIRYMTAEENMELMEGMKIFNLWFIDQKNYIEQELQMNRVLFTNSFASVQLPREILKMNGKKRGEHDTFLQNDIVAYHNYGHGKSNWTKDRAKDSQFFKKWGKPVVMEESGYTLPHLYCATDNNLFLGLWTHAFNQEMANSMNYWSLRGPHDQGMSELYEPYANFFELIDLNQHYETYSALNASIKKSNLGIHAMSDSKNNKSFGFLYDTSWYWRNMTGNNPKVHDLVFNNAMNEPCKCIDGGEIGIPLSNESTNYDDERYHDAFTKEQETNPKSAKNYGTEKIKLKGLRRTGLFKKKCTYRVDYLDPRDPELKVLKSEVLKAGINGSLTLTLDESTWPAAAVKVTLKE